MRSSSAMRYTGTDVCCIRAANPQDVVDDSASEDQLWVDRYRPRKFTDLLGNERAARDAMAWVKQWDWCVFGRAKKGLKNTHKADEKDAYQDEYHRPREKVCHAPHQTICWFSFPASSSCSRVLRGLEKRRLHMSLHARPDMKLWKSTPGGRRPRLPRLCVELITRQ